MSRTFVGFGFGAIQAGLFLYEAQASGHFDRLVVAYRRPEVIKAIRDNNGFFSLNIAHHDHIETVKIGPIDIYDSNDLEDQKSIIAALSEANEIATALGSVKDYVSDEPNSVHRLLAQALEHKTNNAIIYAAENNNHAAEKLQASILKELKDNSSLSGVQFLNTVIGKMSGVVTDESVIKEHKLATITASLSKAFLVESFNKILISEVTLADFKRGIARFSEKPDLLPFEEAKLFGHNATHALAAYIGALLGVERIRDLESQDGIMTFLRQAFLDESGATLIKKYSGIDALFTQEDYKDFADDLLLRMMNPYLNDTVERVGRDPTRKLAWNDRLIGTIREARTQGVQAKRYALGVAAALLSLNVTDTKTHLQTLWQQEASQEQTDILELVSAAVVHLRDWQGAQSVHSLAQVLNDF